MLCPAIGGQKSLRRDKTTQSRKAGGEAIPFDVGATLQGERAAVLQGNAAPLRCDVLPSLKQVPLLPTHLGGVFTR